jgi:sec-independent protein translocase protein TatB
MLGNLGWAEAGVLLVLALFVFGPDRLPGLAQDAGAFLRRLRGYLKGLRDDLTAELGPEVGDLDLASLHPREFVRKHLFEDEDETPLRPLPRVLAPGEPTPWDPDTT